MKNGEQPVNPLAQGYYNINGEEKYINGIGLTKREYFAAMAFQSLITMERIKDNADTIAETAVKYADALLKELEK